MLDLGDVKAGDRIVLFLSGWIFYTDTSINVSISQRKDLAHFPPLLEVPDGAGGWKVAMESFGFPAGKTKTMPVDLTGLVDPKDPRVRIRTTMAIFWDEAFVTVNDPAVDVVTTSLAPFSAVLSERGFPRGYRETPDGPEVFDHGDVSTAPRWEDVPGRVTRLGDVTELLAKTDDRWVAFKGGDAIRITYDASKLPPLAARLAPRLDPRLRRLGQGLRQEHRHGPVVRALAFPRDVGVPLSAVRAPSRSEVPRGDAHAQGRARALPKRAGGKIVLLAREPGRLRRPTVGLT